MAIGLVNVNVCPGLAKGPRKKIERKSEKSSGRRKRCTKTDMNMLLSCEGLKNSSIREKPGRFILFLFYKISRFLYSLWGSPWLAGLATVAKIGDCVNLLALCALR